jgi:hypothetical protein
LKKILEEKALIAQKKAEEKRQAEMIRRAEYFYLIDNF